jgi:FdhD protein
MASTAPVNQVETVTWNGQVFGASRSRSIPEEVAVALTYNGTTHAVMMATPQDLEDYALGFSLTEQQVTSKDQIRSIDIEEVDDGIDLRIWLDAKASTGFRDRRRRIAGPTGCGLCGIESLQQANQAPRIVTGDGLFDGASIMQAQQDLFAAQKLHAQTHAVHAAAFWSPKGGLLSVREDVGRHNALDKLVGAMFRQDRTGQGGLLLLTSRVSVEMVQKAAVLGSPVIVAISTPTALAVRIAEQAGIILVALARNNGFEVFTHAHRIAV